MDTIFFILFLIVWVPLTLFICSKMIGSTTVISFDGIPGLFSEYLGMLITSGIIAAVIIVGPFILFRDYWKWILIIGGGLFFLMSGDKNDKTGKEE